MIWVIKVTDNAGQIRITLPKAFCEEHNIKKEDYVVIDDMNPERMTIGRFEYGKKKARTDNGSKS